MKANKTRPHAPTTHTFTLEAHTNCNAFEAAIRRVDERLSAWDIWQAYQRFSTFRDWCAGAAVNVHVETLAGHLGYTSVYFSR